MFFQDKNQQVDENIAKNERVLQQLLIHMESLNSEIDLFLDDLKVTPQQLNKYLSDPENFTDDNWLELQKQRELLEEKLSRDLKNIRDPRKTQKTQQTRNIQQHWLYVK